MVQDDFDIDQLYAWIDTIPLSRAKKNIARDFSDAVLTAELTAYHRPKLVDIHNYPPTSSKPQKTVNWETLNKKVFSKIGFKVPDAIIQQLVESKPGVIEMVLAELRTKFEKSRPPTALDPMKLNKIKSPASTQGDILDADQVISALNDCQKLEANARSYTRMEEAENKQNNNIPDVQVSKTEPEVGTVESRSGPKRPTPSTTLGYVVRPQTASADMNGNLGPLSTPGGPRPDQAPAQLVYRGHKMVPLQVLENKEKELKNLEFVNGTYTSKVSRLETMMKIKDQRIEDLTHQLQNLRSMYDRLTDASLAGVKK